MFDQFLASGSGLPDPINGEWRLTKALNGTRDGGTRQTRGTDHEGNPSSPQLFRINGSDKVLLVIIQVREQQVVFLLKFFNGSHPDMLPLCLTRWTGQLERLLIYGP